MELQEPDLELLELVALQVAWYVVCGEFHEVYGGPRGLAHRLLELEHAGLINLRNTESPDERITAEMLEADAVANGCYENLEDTREPRWDIVATDAGFRCVEARLGKQ